MRSHEVRIGPQRLPGSLDVPLQPRALILFAHGSGSSRHSPRNRQVAQVLHGCDLATLRFDLLTEDEADARSNVFDIPLLAGRLLQALEWQRGQPSLSALPCGLFGASTGAAAALAAAAEEATAVYAVVSRGGRPDLAGAALPRVVAPTLLVVGGNDPEVLRLNRAALSALRCECELAVVPGATHLFEEPGTLEAAARLAADWFVAHLPV
ncbi:MAG: dienelactone hydrolase family protein [Burkholderiaceae bacterium]|jgi:pimeloyl-ACP methyl ester carboxylesterase